MTHDLPDDTDELKQYIEYLLDQNQFLDQELTDSEKEKLALKQQQTSAGEITGLEDLSKKEAIQEIQDHIQTTTQAAEEFPDLPYNEKLFVAAVELKRLSQIEEYLKEEAPSAWNRVKDKHEDIERTFREVLSIELLFQPDTS